MKRNVTIITVVVVVAFASFASGYLLGLASSSNSRPWLFKGAYAVYSVKAEDGAAISLNYTEKIAILSFNSSELQEETIVNYTTPGQTNSSTTEWVPLNLLGSFYFPVPSGANLSEISQASLQINGREIGCTVYRFSYSAENETETASYYLSNSAKFLVELTLTISEEGTTVTLQQVLVSSNIPGIS